MRCQRCALPRHTSFTLRANGLINIYTFIVKRSVRCFIKHNMKRLDFGKFVFQPNTFMVAAAAVGVNPSQLMEEDDCGHR
eukprot:c31813_g1_i1 orf=109-348(+)